MSNVVAIRQTNGLRDYSPEQMALIRRTVAADTTPDEFNLFMEVCRRVGLDPFRKQIHCVVYNKDDEKKRKVTFITAIDGMRAVAARGRDYRPDDEEPAFEIDEARKGPSNPAGLVKATVRAYKLAPNGEWHRVVGVAYWSEFAPMKQDAEGGYDWVDTGEVWQDSGKPKKRKVPRGEVTEVPSGKWGEMPMLMLAKCAEAQALRKGWPEDLSGIYSPEEMERPMTDITPTDAIAQFEQEKRLKLVGATRSVPIIWKVGDPIVYVPAGQLYDEAAKHIADIESARELTWWRETNSAGIRELWAISKSDGLGVNKLYEDRLKALAG